MNLAERCLRIVTDFWVKPSIRTFSLNTKIHLAVNEYGMPVQFFVTDATIANCTVAETLILGFQAKYLLADRGYDTDATVSSALQASITPVIPPKKNRKVLRKYDKHIYKLRYLVENAFLHLKKMAWHCYALC